MASLQIVTLLPDAHLLALAVLDLACAPDQTNDLFRCVLVDALAEATSQATTCPTGRHPDFMHWLSTCASDQVNVVMPEHLLPEIGLL